MSKIPLKHIHAFRDRLGSQRYYFRPPGGGRRTKLPGKPGSIEFLAAYQAAAAFIGLDVPAERLEIGAARTRAGSIDAAIVGFYGHESYLSLATASRSTRRQSLEVFRREHGTKPIAALQQQHIAKLLAERKPAGARNLLNALKALMRFALLTGLIKYDPAISLKAPKVKAAGGGIHSWNEDEIAAYRASHEIGTTARLALELALNTACRRSDLVEIGPQHIRDGVFSYNQHKTLAPVAMPVHPDLLEVLAATPKTNLRFLMASTGRPFTPNTFGNKFREWCYEAGLPQCSVHGLRKAQARRLAEAGGSAHQIASVTGHKTLSEVQRYADAANREHMARAAMASVTAAFSRDRTGNNSP
jgi:integrase